MDDNIFIWILCWLNSSQAEFILSGYICHSSTYVQSCALLHTQHTSSAPDCQHYATEQIFLSPFTSVFLFWKCRYWHNSIWKHLEMCWQKPHVTSSIVSLLRCLSDLYPACTDGLQEWVANSTLLLLCPCIFIGKIYLPVLHLVCLSSALWPPGMPGNSRFLQSLRNKFSLPGIVSVTLVTKFNCFHNVKLILHVLHGSFQSTGFYCY